MPCRKLKPVSFQRNGENPDFSRAFVEVVCLVTSFACKNHDRGRIRRNGDYRLVGVRALDPDVKSPALSAVGVAPTIRRGGRRHRPERTLSILPPVDAKVASSVESTLPGT